MRENSQAAEGLSTLISMLEASHMEAQEAAMQALLNFAAGNERNKIMIVKAGAIPPVVELLQSKSANLRELAAIVVMMVSIPDANKPVIGTSGAIPLLVSMLASGSLGGKVDAVSALYNLSKHPDNLSIILTAGAIPPLIMLLKHCNKGCKVTEKITALLQSLSIFEIGRSAIANEEGGILALVEAVEDGSFESKENAVSALLTMCQSSRCKYREAILQEGAIPGLLELTVNGTPRTQHKARNLLQLLRDLPESQRPSSALASAMLVSLVYDIATHIDNGEQGPGTAERMLTEMLRLSINQNMEHLCLQGCKEE